MRTMFAPAKVNLYLHVGALQPDGYHPLESLMVFADVGDMLSFEPADAMELEVIGEFAATLGQAPIEDNLVTRAVRLLLDAARSSEGARLTLTKNLPIAAGLGGGSSDAGAALRLVRDALGLAIDDAGLARIADTLGADGVACLAARPVLARGRGDRIEPISGLPALDAVLVNPRAPCATGAVYRAYDAERPPAAPGGPGPPEGFVTASALIEHLRSCRNDLERPAALVAPEVAEVLAVVRGQAETRLGRLSGSGATVFALCDDAHAASALRDAIGRTRPAWWCVACRLGGPWVGDETSPSGSPRRTA